MTNEKGVLLGAYNKKNEMVAANVYLICGDTLYYKFSTSRLDSLLLRPNNLLIWEGIKFAKERDLRYLDLGSSGFVAQIPNSDAIGRIVFAQRPEK